MIPVKLRLKGIYSFQKEQTIDFSTLLQSHIFGIFGKVGSGKSTILEAITFALYGKSNRLKNRQNYNLMNLSSNELFIEFIFKAGNEQQYKVIVQGKRNKKQFDDVKTFKRTLYQLVADDWIPVDTKIEDIIGLSADNFRRTIIIPQGKFQEFLSLTSSGRTDMLKEIFSLQKYDLYYKASALDKQNQEAISHINGQLEQLGSIEEKSINQLQAQLKNTLQNLEKLNTIQQKESSQLQELEQLKNDYENYKVASTDYSSFVDKYQGEYARIEQEVIHVKYCNEHFKALFIQKATQKQDILNIQKNIKLDQSALKDAKNTVLKLTADIKKTKEEANKKEQYLKTIREIEKTIEINKFQGKLDDVTKHSTQIITKISNLKTELKKNNAAIQKTNKELAQLAKKLPDFTQLIKIRDWFTQNQHILDDIKIEEQELQTTQDKIKIIQDKKTKTLAPMKLDSKLKDLSLDDTKNKIEQLAQSIKNKIKILSEEVNKLDAQQLLHEHAQDLKPGESCPVCGATEHPNKLSNNDLEAKIKKSKAQLAHYEKDYKLHDDAVKLLIDLASSQAVLQDQVAETNKKIKELHTALKSHKQSIFWKDKKMTLPVVHKNIKQHHESQAKIKLAEKAKIKLEKQDQLLEQQLEELSPKMEDYQKQIHQLTSKIETLTEQISKQNRDKLKSFSTKELGELLPKYQKRIDENQSKFDQLTKDLKAAEAAQTTHATSLKRYSQGLQKEQTVLDQLTNKIGTQLASSPFETIMEISDFLSKQIDTKQQLERVNKYKSEVIAKQEKLALLTNRIKQKKFNQAAFTKLNTSVQERKEQIQLLIGTKAETQLKIKESKQKLTSKKKLEKTLEQLLLRKDNIATLTKLFKGQGFVNYISSVYLQNIVQNANQRFQELTRHELSLELAQDNSFDVLDRLNGGKSRSIRTLSGGQMFQAALSLALALADNIYELSKAKQNFFFLDEGFGTQDSDSITDVFKTLKALRKENRTVGIISHVEQLQQEIDVHLVVTKDGEEGSTISESWAQ